MEEEFIPYEEALALKELGFNENCFGFFGAKELFIKITNKERISESNVLAPLYQQAFRWFREKYKLYNVVHQFEHKKGTDEEFLSEVVYAEATYHKTYDEAELECLRKLIEIVKQK